MASAAIRELNKENIDPVSANTVRRALQDIGGKARRVIMKPKLLKRHLEVRMEFAKKYKIGQWTIGAVWFGQTSPKSTDFSPTALTTAGSSTNRTRTMVISMFSTLHELSERSSTVVVASWFGDV